MWKTVLALLVTIIVIPILAFSMDEPLTLFQKEILVKLLIVYLVAALLCFVVSTLTNNYSQVDKLWSLIPMVYVWMVAVHSEFEPRLILMALLVTVWGLRLTYNFSRRGGTPGGSGPGRRTTAGQCFRAKPEFKRPVEMASF